MEMDAGRGHSLLNYEGASQEQLIAELEGLRADLEEQAKRLNRERAAERVRAEAMAMRSSDDLLKVVAVMFQEMVGLGVETPGSSISFIDEENDRVIKYLAWENPRKYGLTGPQFGVEVVDEDTVVFTENRSTHEEHITPWREHKPESFREVQSVEWWVESLKPMGFDVDTSTDLSFWAGEWFITNVPFESPGRAKSAHPTGEDGLTGQLGRGCDA